jgi:hypothetical protein
VRPPPLDYRHLLRLTDAGGLFEHADRLEPRREHGYCVDDMARAIVVVARDEAAPQDVRAAGDLYLHLVLDAMTPNGRVHNRLAYRGGWTDAPTVNDCWGRALWALGTVAAQVSTIPAITRRRALDAFERGARNRSPHLRAMAYAGLGAAEVLCVEPRHAMAQVLLTDAARFVDTRCVEAATGAARATPTRADWPWPEPRLRYANAVLPEVLMAAGGALQDEHRRDTGLSLLTWVVRQESAQGDQSGHLSVTPAHGWGAGEPRPGFDQQPIEVAALAEACARAYLVTGERQWHETLLRCAAWFEGANDVALSLADSDSGGGRDGLHIDRVNENQGAESTLALLSVRQQVRRVSASAR